MAVSSICARIKLIRQTLGISQNDFSDGIFLTQSSYSKIERGAVEPNKRTLEIISTTYHISKDWLISGEGEMFSAPAPDPELDQLMKIIKELDPLFKEYIIQQIKLFAKLHKSNKETVKAQQTAQKKKT